MSAPEAVDAGFDDDAERDAADDASDELDPAEGEEPDDGHDPGDASDDEVTAQEQDTDAEFWSALRVAPVEVSLPGGTGYTLRAYRLSTELAAPEIDPREDDFIELRRQASGQQAEQDEEEEPIEPIDEAELTKLALAAGRKQRDTDEDDDEIDGDSADGDTADESDEPEGDAEDAGDDEDTDDTDDADAEEDDEVEDAADAEPDEVPVFLSRRGRLLLFRSKQGLVKYVREATGHELEQLDTWADVKRQINASHVAPTEEDRYELDLVVENLRGGHDAWDPDLIIQAGEFARDVAYALRIGSVLTALSPGSPLDDLDEGLRTIESGGLGAFFARRRLRKIDAQTTAALGWRTIIGKISALVDWRN